jgi:hypothetical protein
MKLNIVVVPQLGDLQDELVEIATKLAAMSLLEEMAMVEASSIPSVGGEAWVISRKGSSRTSLDGYVSSLRNLREVNVVGLFVVPAEETIMSDVATTLVAVKHEMSLMVGRKTSVQEVRLFATSIDQFGIDGCLAQLESLSSIGASNFVIVPEDRSTPQSAARAIDQNDPDFGLHLVTEMSSVLGQWRGFSNDSHSVNQAIGGGRNTPLIRFSRSFLRFVHAPVPTHGTIIPPNDVLPLPQGFEPFPDPEWAARELAGRLFPEEFVFNRPVREDERLKLGPWQILLRFSKEFGQTIAKMPRFYSQGIAKDLENSAASAIRQVYGETSWVTLIDQSGATDDEQEESVFEQLETRLNAQTERPNLNEVPAAIWERLVRRFLGLIDGNNLADDLRRDLGSSTYLLADRKYVADRPPASWEEFVAPYVPDIAEIGEDVSIDVGSGTSSKIDESEPVENVGVDDEGQDTVTRRQLPSKGVELHLSGRIAKRFTDERINAESTLSHYLQRVGTFQNRRSEITSQTSKSVVVAVILAISALVVLRTAFTSWHTTFGFDAMASIDRARLWVIFTLMLLFVASLNLAPDGAKRAQTYFVVISSAFAAGLGASILYFGPVYRGVRRVLAWSGETPILVISAGAILLVITTFTRRGRRGMLARDIRRKLMIGMVYVYALTGTVVGLSRKGSFIQNMDSDSRTRLGILIGLVAGVALASSLVVVTLLRIRERNQFALWERDLRWSIQAAEVTARDLKVLSLREVQWSGTALALSRLVWSPLGQNQEIVDPEVNETTKMSLNKFQIASIELNDEGLQFLTARARRTFVGRGWLQGQYERASRNFSLRHGRELGYDDEDSMFVRPETCSFPETLENIVCGDISSRRWQYAKMLVSGQLDQTLSDEGLSEAINSSYREVLARPELYSLDVEYARSIEDFLSPLDDFEDGPGELPARVIGLAPLAFNGPEASPECFWWWPKSLVSSNNGDAIDSSRSSEEGDVVVAAGKLELSGFVSLTDLGVRIQTDNSDQEFEGRRGL